MAEMQGSPIRAKPTVTHNNEIRRREVVAIAAKVVYGLEVDR